jgi:hypothetical protein
MTDIASRVDGLSPEKRALLARIVRQTLDEMARLLEPEYWQETPADAPEPLRCRRTARALLSRTTPGPSSGWSWTRR